MKTLIIPEGEGKTTELIKRSAETNFYIVCISREEANRIQNKALESGLSIPLPITYEEFNKGQHGWGIKGFLIDNADIFLQSLTNVKIDTITVSN